MGGVKQEWDAAVCEAAAGLQPGGLQQLAGDDPVQQAPHDAEQMIEAAWTRPGPGDQEVLQQGERHPAEAADVILVGQAHAPAAPVCGPAVELAAVRLAYAPGWAAVVCEVVRGVAGGRGCRRLSMAGWGPW
jgi:hypothetical protein